MNTYLTKGPGNIAKPFYCYIMKCNCSLLILYQVFIAYYV